MEKYFAINRGGSSIRCKLYCEKNQELKKVILSVHGFAGHKDNAAAKKFAERVLAKYKNTAVLTFDLPCHGEDVKKKAILRDFLAYLELVTAYIKEELGAEEIYAYAASFGAYLVLLLLAEKGNPYRKIALRCPAVNMAESLRSAILTPRDLETLQKGKPVRAGFDRKIEIDSAFLSELEAADVRQLPFFDYADEILILHGTKDEIVPFMQAAEFADNNVIELVAVENADHRFQNPACMEAATKAVLSFFEL